jgi:hypothetical protein
MRPKSLSEVAELVAEGEFFSICLGNFLDEFYLAPQAEALQEPPRRLAAGLGRRGEIVDAYLAAVAEELGRKYQYPMPDWIRAEELKLRHPWFASELAGLRAVLLFESPLGFRSRNLFVSENALSRA